MQIGITLAVNQIQPVTSGGGGGGGGAYSPSLDFSDDRNSQYIACIF